MTEAPLEALGADIDGDIHSLRPDLRVLAAGAAATALLSFVFLPLPTAIASALLGGLMIAGADVDARVYLLPDIVTCGATLGGVLAAFFLTPEDPWRGVGFAILRALGAALALLALRGVHLRLRGVEGLGLGDVKLAAAIGAWLPLDRIPLCFALAASAALASVAVRASRSDVKTMRVPFGAYLCPALWLLYFAGALSA